MASGDVNMGDKVLLKIGDEKNWMELVPGKGGMLNQLVLNGIEVVPRVYSVGDDPFDPWFSQAWLFPFPNRIEEGIFRSKENTLHFPINEKGNNCAIHGVLFDKPYQVTAQKRNSERCEVVLEYSPSSTIACYPFIFRFMVAYVLQRSKLTIAIQIQNGEKTKDLPFALGWHPYFHLDGSLTGWKLSTPKISRIPLSESSLPLRDSQPIPYQFPSPLGQLKLDDCFQIQENNAPVRFQLASQSHQLQIGSNEGFNYWQLFIPPSGDKIAIEPMTCSVNDPMLGRNIIYLKPGETYRKELTIKLTTLRV